jgi:hypothetical protein
VYRSPDTLNPWTAIQRASGGREVASRPSKTYPGSKKRAQRITLRGNWTPELWIVVVVLLFTLFVVVPWMIRHTPLD